MSASFFPILRHLGIGTCIVVLATTGCKPVGPNYSKPGLTAPSVYKEAGDASLTQPLPPDSGSWKSANPSDGLLWAKWWEIYKDPQLNQLEEEVAVNNQNVRAAAENFQAATEQTVSIRASLYPSLSLTPGFSHQRLSNHKPNANANTTYSYNDLMASGQGSWEPDFWGKVRRSAEAANNTAQADSALLAGVILSLQAELAGDYFALRGLDSETQILKATVADLDRQHELTQKRLSGGVVTEVDVSQSLTQLETVRAQLAEVGVTRALLEHAIGTLISRDLSRFSVPFSPLALELPVIPVGIPSQLLERRPDIAAQERLTAAANARIGVTIAAYYPTLNLSGAGGFESTHGGTWLQGPSSLWSLGAQATQILFDAGQRHALTGQARDQYEAQAATYRDTVYKAFEDVEDNLSTLRILGEEAAVEQRAVTAAQHSLELSNRRYKGGVAAYLEVLMAETTLLNDQRTLTDLKSRQFSASVQLVRSMGGGWDTTKLPR